MKTLPAIAVIVILSSCSTPNNSASTRISTAPGSNDPSTTMPATGTKPPYNNRVQQTTGTSPAPAALPDNNTGGTGADSTAHR